MMLNLLIMSIMSNRLNFDTFVDLSDFVRRLNNSSFIDEDTQYDIAGLIDVIISSPLLVNNLKETSSFSVKPAPDDLFVMAISKLRDSGDIDCLVRSLSWQQNDIAFLSNELKNYERTLVKLDSSLKCIAKLRDDAVKLRKRNSELLKTIQKLRDCNKSLKQVVYVKKKN